MKTPAPKAAKATVDLVVLSRTGTDLDALSAALAEARSQIEAATRARDAAGVAYRDRILDASTTELETLQADKARATVELDRAEALVAALTRRIASVREDQERGERKARHADAAAKCEAIRARLPAEYRKHALALRLLLRDLAEAEAARVAVEPLMSEFGQIASVEGALRRLDSVPEEIVGRDEVKLWTIDGRADPVPADRQANVQPRGNAGKGYLYPVNAGSAVGRGQPFDCTLRRYARTRYQAAIPSPRSDGSLLNIVHLPDLDAYAEDLVTAERFRSVDTALAHLSREVVEPGEHERPVLERLEMLPDDPSAVITTRAWRPERSVA